MSAEQQTEKLANYIQKNFPEEISDGGAGDIAIKIINKLKDKTDKNKIEKRKLK